MPRQMSTAVATAIASGQIFPALFVQATFVTGPVYLWSGIGPIVWNGHTWTGLGSMGSVSPIDEAARVEAKGITLTLSGIDSTLLPDVLGEFQLGQPALIYLGFFSGASLILDPLLAFSGRMDIPQLDVGGQTATLSVNCESRLVDMDVAVDRRLTPEDQQRDWPGDIGLQFVPSIQEMSLYWGTSPTTSANV